MANIIQNPPPALIRKSQLASRLSVTTRTIDNWMAANSIPCIKLKRVVLFDIEAVLQSLRKFERKARP